MKPSEVKEAIKACIRARQPAFIWGSPGLGKSDVMRQVCRELDLNLIDIRATLLDPVDLRGLPTIDKETGSVKWNPPGFLPSAGSGVILLDELNSAVLSVQAACYQLVLDRKVGEYTLPEGYIVMAAGNRETDRAVTHRMPSALANRFVHINFEADFADWKAWALLNDIAPEVTAFLEFRKELLNQFDPQKNDKAFPSSRSWEFASNIIKSKPQEQILHPLLTGTVGEGAAVEFNAFFKIYKDLPDPQIIIQSPQKAPVPTDPATLYAVCGALAHLADKKSFASIKEYADRLQTEFGVLLVIDSSKRNPEIVNTTAFINWVSQNSDVLI